MLNGENLGSDRLQFPPESDVKACHGSADREQQIPNPSHGIEATFVQSRKLH